MSGNETHLECLGNETHLECLGNETHLECLGNETHLGGARYIVGLPVSAF